MPDAITRLNAALSDRYRIESELGEGGMATVYLADDLKHERKVALKVLKPELAAVVGAERFLAEIKTTANLQHPHILGLYDSGEADGMLFYVMPYVQGESLRARLDRDLQLPVDDAVRIATNVAEALDFAHRQGVIHRDIKPANILLQDDKPVISDFGIALAVSASGGGRLTETGLSLGTPHYMSPEQATGDQHVGPATDIFALGCVLYEMLVGEPPFTGSTPQAVLGKIISGEPDLVTVHRRSVQPNVAAAIARSLERVPADRFGSARDLASGLGDPAFRHRLTTTAPGRPSRRELVLAATALVALVFGVTGRLNESGSRPVNRLVLDVPRVVNEWGPSALISPDGRTIAYTGPDLDAQGFGEGATGWWMRSMDALDSEWLFTFAEFADFAPDGQALAFRTGAYVGEIRIKSLQGDQVEMITDSAGAAGVHWGTDDYIYFSLRQRGIGRILAAGGPIEQVTRLDATRGELIHRWPQLLPGEDAVLFTVARTSQHSVNDRDIAVARLEGDQVHRILAGGVFARFTNSGHLLVVGADGTLSAFPFDGRRLEITGPAVEMLDGVAVHDGERGIELDISDEGTLLYVTQASDDTDDIVIIDRAGVVVDAITGWGGRVRYPALSPDGTMIAATVFRDLQPPNIFGMRLSQREPQRLTFGNHLDYTPKWAADGSTFFFVGPRPPNSTDWDLYVTRADGTVRDSLVLDPPGEVRDAVPSPDGRWLVYTEETAGRLDLFMLPYAEGGEPIELVVTRFDEDDPAFSPNGEWLAYTSTEGGRQEVYVIAFPESTANPLQVSLQGGSEPRWSRDGQEIFFIDPSFNLVSASVVQEPALRIGERDVLFSVAAYKVDEFDVTPDGSFVFARRSSLRAAGDLVIIQNFHEELRARVGN